MGSQHLPESTDFQADLTPKTVRQIPRFLGMLNFYRRFLPNAATLQDPHHDDLSGPKMKGYHPVQAIRASKPASRAS